MKEMMNKTLIAGGAMAALAVTGLTGTALATPSTDQIVQAQSFSFDLSPGSQTIAFDQFDDNGGLFILQSVEVQMTASVGAQVQATNTSGIDAEQFGVNIVGNVTVDISDINTTAGIFQSESVPPGDLPIVSGQTWDFGLVQGTNNAGGAQMSNLGGYIGNGTINADVSGNGGFAIEGVTNALLTIDDFGASGTVTLIYNYKIIPAPGAFALLGMAGLLGARRRRA